MKIDIVLEKNRNCCLKIEIVVYKDRFCCLKVEIFVEECHTLIQEAFDVALNFENRSLVSALIFLLSSLKCEIAKQRSNSVLISHTYQWNVEDNPLNQMPTVPPPSL